MSGELKITTPGEYRQKNSFLLKVSDSLTILRRKVDPVELIFSGFLQLPALNAAQKFEEMRAAFNDAKEQDDKDKAAKDFLSGNEKNDILEMLRKFACENVLAPRLVMEPLKPGDDSAICVLELTFVELMTIFNAEPPDVVEAEGPVKTRAQIEEFRRPEPGVAGDAGQPGEEVRKEAELIHISPERDVIYA
jgi:hypothetical protein